jgi:hypothetical protein
VRIKLLATPLLAACAFLLLSGCSKKVNNDEAIRQAVITHLSKRGDLTMSQMEVTVSNVTYKENEAEATIGFKPKGGGAASGMQMRYSLERKGGEWVVKGKADSGASPHGAMAPGAGQGMPPAAELPPDHPPMGGAAPKK